ncbi:uncharacterized protein J3D65DRAFT_655301 [Phyllosticta citribraziliensis]|uniref:Uncharacterized protein n=1 Tax=Phyllosticta citribraziliensis TaxID=989973 RepID=A0ABR1MCU7_9PEZI
MSNTEAYRPSTKPPRIPKMEHTCIKFLDEFYQDVQNALDHVFPTDAPRTYSKVNVMGLTWANDDLDCKTAQEKLLRVFREKYNFATQSFVIPVTREPTDATTDIIDDWIPFTSEVEDDELYIVLYNGRGASTEHTLWFAGARDVCESLGVAKPWLHVWMLRAHAWKSGHSRFLHVFDTCQAPSAALHFGGPECLSAAGFQETPPGAENGFTSVLARHLEALDGEPRSVAQIYADIVRQQQQYGLEATPIRLPEVDKPSVVLARQGRVPQQMGNLTQSSRTGSIQAMAASTLRVLISVNVAVDMAKSADARDWKERIAANLPPLLREVAVEVESALETDASLLLLFVSMPVEIWDGLPEHKEAYNFVSFVKKGGVGS